MLFRSRYVPQAGGAGNQTGVGVTKEAQVCATSGRSRQSNRCGCDQGSTGMCHKREERAIKQVLLMHGTAMYAMYGIDLLLNDAKREGARSRIITECTISQSSLHACLGRVGGFTRRGGCDQGSTGMDLLGHGRMDAMKVFCFARD